MAGIVKVEKGVRILYRENFIHKKNDIIEGEGEILKRGIYG